MNYPIRYSNNNKATLCAGKTCITVYGETARAIQQIVLFIAIVVAITTIAKALR